jgi:hypothetical protein
VIRSYVLENNRAILLDETITDRYVRLNVFYPSIADEKLIDIVGRPMLQPIQLATV